MFKKFKKEQDPVHFEQDPVKLTQRHTPDLDGFQSIGRAL